MLGDPEKRGAYDQLGMNWKAGQEFRPPPGWEQGFEFRQGFGGGGGGGADRFSDFFESLFGGSPFGGARRSSSGFSGFQGGGGFRSAGESYNFV